MDEIDRICAGRFAEWGTHALKKHADRLSWQASFCIAKHVGAPCGRMFDQQARDARDELAVRARLAEVRS